MKEAQDEMTSSQRLELIYEMIHEAKASFEEDGFFFLLWGWLTILGSISHFLLQTIVQVWWAFIPWVGVALVGTTFTWVEVQKRKRNRKLRTYFEQMVLFLWIGISALLFILMGVSMAGMLAFSQSYPLLMLLFGLGTFISGGVLRFKPLIWGGILAWCIGITAFYLSFNIQILLIGLTVLVSYLIPGYLLKREYTR